MCLPGLLFLTKLFEIFAISPTAPNTHDVHELSKLVQTLQTELHRIFAQPHILLEQNYYVFEYWGLYEYHEYIQKEHEVSSADMSITVKLYEHFRDVANGNTPDPTMLEAREVAEQYIKCHIRGHMKCIDKNFDEFLNGQFAPSQITPGTKTERCCLQQRHG